MMHRGTVCCLFFFFLITIIACSEFDLAPQIPFETYCETFGSSDFDVAFSAVYLEEENSYIVVGSSGPLEKKARAFISKIERKTGSFIDYKIVGTSFDRTESLNHIIQTKDKNFKAVGFSQLGGESHILSTTFSSGLNDIIVDSLNSASWDEGNSIIETENEFLISGAWGNFIGGVHEQNRTSFDGAGFITPDFGRIRDAMYDTRKYGIMVGYFCPGYNCNLDGSGSHRIFLGQYAPNELNLVHRNDTLHNDGYKHSTLEALTQIDIDSSYIAIGKVWNNEFDNKIIFARFDFGLNPIGNLITYDGIDGGNYFGGNASARDIIAVEDGVIITGFEAKEDIENTDLLIAKLDFNGNLMWKETYDRDNQDDFGWSILSDREGFFVVGQTKPTEGQKENTSKRSSVLIMKTDNQGKIAGSCNSL